MQKQQFSIEIRAPRERVWNTLFENKSFRDWGSVIDEDGQYMVGELKEGNEIQFLSENGFGVTTFVEKLIPNEFISFRMIANTIDSGKREREKEWTGGEESFSLAEKDDVTALTVHIDVPEEMQTMFQDRFPRALERVKVLAEKKG